MAYDPAQLRLERFNIEVGYDAAFLYWNLRGILAERWAHGPVFGGWGLAQEQTSLNPGPGADDTRITAVLGIKASGLFAEGPTWTPEAPGLAQQWLADVIEVLHPQRAMRVAFQLFGIYHVANPEQASRRLRGHFYRPDNLTSVMPERLRADHRDNFHSAINWMISESPQVQTSLILGVLGPPHQGFFQWPDAERDSEWWMGVNYSRVYIVPDGERIDAPLEAVGVQRGRKQWVRARARPRRVREPDAALPRHPREILRTVHHTSTL